MSKTDIEVDLEGDGSGYSGTFRWKSSKVLQSLPPSVKLRHSLDYSTWMKYFISRGRTTEAARQIVLTVQNDLSIIDCLSTPMSICYLFEKSIFKDSRCCGMKFKRITLLCMGCSSKAEERVLRNTDSFHELSYYFHNFQHVDLWLIGPEMSRTEENAKLHRDIVPDQLFSCSVYKGTAIDFIRSHPACINKHTVVVGFNCGFGNFENNTPSRYDLMLNWLPDLYFLTGTTLPLMFTCANDYADLAGEVALMSKILGANFILAPQENPFSYASTMVPPSAQGSGRNQQQASEFSQGNSFCYGVQGSSKERRHKLDYASGRKCLPQFIALLKAPTKNTTTAHALMLNECSTDFEPVVTVTGEVCYMTNPDNQAVAPRILDGGADSSGVIILDPTGLEVVSAETTTGGARDKAERLPGMAEPQQQVEPLTEVEAAAAPVTSLDAVPPLFHCTQSVAEVAGDDDTGNSNKKLTVTLVVPASALMDIAAVDLQVSDDGTLLVLTLPPWTGRASSPTAVSDGFVVTHKIQLAARVKAETMTAKLSKRKNTLSPAVCRCGGS